MVLTFVAFLNGNRKRLEKSENPAKALENIVIKINKHENTYKLKEK